MGRRALALRLADADPFADPFAPTVLARPAVALTLGLAWFGPSSTSTGRPSTSPPTRPRSPAPTISPPGASAASPGCPSSITLGQQGPGDRPVPQEDHLLPPARHPLRLAAPRLFRPRAALSAVAYAFAAAFTIEAGRYFLPHHRPSTTDLGLQVAGAWLGFRVTQHILAIFWAESTLYGYLYQQPPPRPTLYAAADY